MNTHARDAIHLYGTDAPAEPRRTLHAGPLSCELDAGNLRYLRVGGVEALRAVSFVVRDPVWGTYGTRIDNLAVDQRDDGFTVSYTAQASDSKQSLRYQARIEADAGGALRFAADVEPLSDFETNRVGFVVLHPLVGVVGREVEVLHVDGTRETSVFPERVDPWQPFMNLRALTHEVSPGVRITCHMEGDTFEMEDHRNWTDASFKTYIRPLDKPAPFVIAKGEVTQQSVAVSIDGAPPAASEGDAGSETVSLAHGNVRRSGPRIGVGLHPRRLDAAFDVAQAMATLAPQVLLCHYDPRDGHGEAQLRRFGEYAARIGATPALEAIVPCEGEGDYHADAQALAAAIKASGTAFESIAVAPGPDLIAGRPFSDWPSVPPLGDLYDAVRAALPGVPIGGGSFSYFTELNRRRPPAAHIDFLSHVTAAIVHAADDTSVTETLEALPDVIATASDIHNGKPYRVGPVGIGSRHSPFGGEPTANDDGERRAMARIDPRQRGLLGASYYLGYAARMLAGDVEALTLCAPCGEFGLAHAPMPWLQPGFDDRGGVFPAYHVVRGLAAMAGQPCAPLESSAPSAVVGFSGEADGRAVAWLANLGVAPREANLSNADTYSRIAVMDSGSFATCTARPDGLDAVERAFTGQSIQLAPYAIVRLRA